jgi:hypothetical protein
MSIGTTTVSAPRSRRSQVIGGIEKVIGGMTNQTRQRIMDEAVRHVGSCGEHRIAKVVAKTLRVEERVVDAVVIASYLEQRTRLAALETGLRGALQMSTEAGRALWSEIAGAA